MFGNKMPVDLSAYLQLWLKLRCIVIKHTHMCRSNCIPCLLVDRHVVR